MHLRKFLHGREVTPYKRKVSELQDGEKIKPMTMGALLVALEQQNSMF